MTAATQTGLSGSAAAARLQHCLERQAAPRLAGRRARVAQVRRSPAGAATSYAAEVVSVRLADGTGFRCFLKDYGSSRRPRPAAALRRERELAVYQHLIGSGELGTARYCGAVWDDGAPLHWLLLELVPGVPLRQLETRFWVEAASRLAQLHAHLARAPLLRVRPLLERHDARFFAAAAERARRSVSRYSAPAARRLERVLAVYEASLDLLAGEEMTPVHGHYEAANILVDESAQPVRICPVDWELAALGSRSFDLASLCDGFRPPTLDRIWDAYAKSAVDAGLSVPVREELRRGVDGFRLHRVIAWLGDAAVKHYLPAGVERLLTRGETLLPLLER